MIENSFIHLPGIGADRESKFWALGVHSWEHLASNLPEYFGAKRVSTIAQALEESRAALESGELKYFQQRLKGPDVWRLLPLALKAHANRIVYLDIETTGLGFPPQCESTSIAVLYGGELHLEWEPSRKRQLLRQLDREATFFVTFNGSSFDLPFLRREFNVALSQPHLDLRHWFARLGHRGGLKQVQQNFSDQVRARDSMDIDGFDAVKLWKLHLRGVERALETLLTYNAEDTVVLRQLAYLGLNLEAESRAGISLPRYTIPEAIPIPTQVCPKVYAKLR